MIEMEQAALKKNLEKARMSYQDVIQRLGSTTLSFIRKTGEKDVIFGSVNVTDIKEELDKLGFVVEKKKILLTEPIKRLGNYSIPVKVFLDDMAEVGVQVISEEEAKKKGKDVPVPEPLINEGKKDSAAAGEKETVEEKSSEEEQPEPEKQVVLESQDTEAEKSGQPEGQVDTGPPEGSAVDDKKENEKPETDDNKGDNPDLVKDKTSP
jgi:large subunit ribosomal protein L9